MSPILNVDIYYHLATLIETRITKSASAICDNRALIVQYNKRLARQLPLYL